MKSTRRDATSGGWAGRPHRQRERGHRHPVRIVGVDDVRLELLHDAREPQRRVEIHFRHWRQRHELETFRRALAQLARRMRDERGAMPERRACPGP